MKIRPALVVKVDGLDGAGKTTLLSSLYDHYVKNKYSVGLVCEFGENTDEIVSFKGNEIGLFELLNQEAKSLDGVFDDIERELIWILISRRTNRKIIPKLVSNYDLILVDRSNMGNIAYGSVIDKKLNSIYEVLSTPVEVSDIKLWLDTPIDSCVKRLSSKKLDVIEIKGKTFFELVRSHYENIYKSDESVFRIDGACCQEDIIKKAISIINKVIKDKRT